MPKKTSMPPQSPSTTLSISGGLSSLKEDIAQVIPLSRIIQPCLLFLMSGIGFLNINFSLAISMLDIAISLSFMVFMLFLRQRSPRASAVANTALSAYSTYQIFQTPPLLLTLEVSLLAAMIAFERWRGMRLSNVTKTMLLSLVGTSYHVIMPSPGSITVLPDENHADTEMTKEIISSVANTCSALEGQCVAVFEGHCLELNGALYRYIDPAAYAKGNTVSTHSFFSLPKTLATECTYGIAPEERYGDSALLNRLSTLEAKYHSSLTKIYDLAKKFENICRTILGEKPCYFSSKWFKDNASILKREQFLSAKNHLGMELNDGMLSIGDKLRHKVKSGVFSQELMKQAQNIYNNASRIIDDMNVYSDELMTLKTRDGDDLAINAIKNLLHQLRQGINLMLVIGSKHLEKGTELTKFLSKLNQDEGIPVLLSSPPGASPRPFTPIPKR